MSLRGWARNPAALLKQIGLTQLGSREWKLSRRDGRILGWPRSGGYPEDQYYSELQAAAS
jgi:hypothetical protein